MTIHHPRPGSGRPAAALRPGRPPSRSVVVAGALVGACCLLPLLYLAGRAAFSGALADTVLRSQSLGVAGRTALLTVTVSLAATALGLPLAWLTARTDLPGRRLLTGLLALPLAVPSYVAAFTAVTALGPRGLLFRAVEPLTGWERLPEIYGFPGAFLVLTLLNYPYAYLAARARFAGMDASLREAAQVLGAGRWRRFRRVTLPLLSGALLSGGLLSALYTLSDFGAVSLLRYETFTWAIYNHYRGSLDRETAAGLALLLVFATLLVLAAVRWIESRTAPPAPGAVRPRRPKPTPLGGFRWPAFALCLAVLVPALLLPTVVCLYWWIRAPGGAAAGLLPALGRTGLAAALAAGCTTAAAFPVAFLAVRFRSRATAALRSACHLGFGLPGLVVGLSLVWFSVNAAPFLYQTLALLVFAYAVHSLPQALGPLEASLAPLSPRLDDAARTLGAGWWRRQAAVTLPLLRPGIAAGSALVFLTTVKELPATLMLAPTGFRTLATTVWSAAENVELGRAAAAGLALLALSMVALLFVLRETARLTPAARRVE